MFKINTGAGIIISKLLIEIRLVYDFVEGNKISTQ